MKQKKLQVFLSSTFKDLKVERQAAVEAILSSGHIPAGMELFSAGDESQMQVIKRWIDESDVFLLILAGRYGSIEPRSGKSYTQLEFEYALERGKPLFAVVISQRALESKVKTDGLLAVEQENSKALNEFRSLVTRNLVKFWDDPKDIKIAIHETISDFDYRKELVGWVRSDNSVNTAFLAEEIAKLTKENSELRSKLLEFESNVHIKFGGLSYFQMKELLEAELLKDSGTNKQLTLFDFFMQVAEGLSKGCLPNTNSKEFDKLVLFKLAKKHFERVEGFPFSRINYFFTEDGQNFYLRSVSLLKTESSI